MTNQMIAIAPAGIGKKSWKRWRSAMLIDPGSSSVPLIHTVAREMHQRLNELENTANWITASYYCLEMLWVGLEKWHGHTLPQMSCKRSGRCCHKQTPRVSRYELIPMVTQIHKMPENLRAALLRQAYGSMFQSYRDPITGEGVRCPMLIHDPNTKEWGCAVHTTRPVICRLASVSTMMSWDCPIWQVMKESFPTLGPELVQPYVDLFEYCRDFFGNSSMNKWDERQSNVQMVLIGTGVATTLNMPQPPADRIPQKEIYLQYAPSGKNTYYQKTSPPPDTVPRTPEGYRQAAIEAAGWEFPDTQYKGDENEQPATEIIITNPVES